MTFSRQIRTAAALFIVLPLMLPAQTPMPPAGMPASQLPPTPATSLSAPPSVSAAPPPASRALVTYDRGQISVTADNASLNQILRDISQKTGMKITGGVADERVYGNYGPAAPAQVLALLLDGTASNMILVQSATAVPSELILTPRNGGPSPPNPNAASSEDNSSRYLLDRRPSGPPARFPGNSAIQNNNGNVPPNSNVPSPPVSTPPTAQSADGATTTQQSPSGAKTPQQIYEQLQQLQLLQQQQKSQPQ